MLKFNDWSYLHYNTTGNFFAHLLIFFRRSTVRSELHYYTTGDFNMSIWKKQNEPNLHYSTTSSFQKCMLKFNEWTYSHYNTTGHFFAHLLIFFEGPQFDQSYTTTLQVISTCLSQRSKMSLVYTTALQAVFKSVCWNLTSGHIYTITVFWCICLFFIEGLCWRPLSWLHYNTTGDIHMSISNSKNL